MGHVQCPENLPVAPGMWRLRLLHPPPKTALQNNWSPLPPGLWTVSRGWGASCTPPHHPVGVSRVEGVVLTGQQGAPQAAQPWPQAQVFVPRLSNHSPRHT